MSDEIWVLGATGRTGRAIARRLHQAGSTVVLVGRDGGRLAAVAAELGGAPRLVVGSLESSLTQLAREAPAVVVNTVGPFTRTALQVVRACPAGTSYVDLSNEYPAIDDVLRLDRQAARAGQVLVAGAAFGVLATESLVVRLCEDRPRPARVRVDAMASVDSEAGPLGTALAETIAEVAAFGGGQVRGGRLVRSHRVSGGNTTLTTPDGSVLTTGSGASGELRAAWHASDADDVVAASTLAPTNPLVRLVLPAATALFRIGPVRRVLVARIARIRLPEAARSRASSWAHARVEWPSGDSREGWLRLGDASEFTADTAAEVTLRLLRGEGRPGAHTPATLFGAGLAEAVGGEFVLPGDPAPTR